MTPQQINMLLQSGISLLQIILELQMMGAIPEDEEAQMKRLRELTLQIDSLPNLPTG